MKKLHLHKIFHWLYAFLMFYPILCFFGTVVISAFNNTFSLTEYDLSSLSASFWDVIDMCTFGFDSGTVGHQIHSIFSYVINDLLGPELTDVSSMVIDILTYWTCISLVYLVFDVLMLPINIAHHWIDAGGDKL